MASLSSKVKVDGEKAASAKVASKATWQCQVPCPPSHLPLATWPPSCPSNELHIIMPQPLHKLCRSLFQGPRQCLHSEISPHGHSS